MKSLVLLFFLLVVQSSHAVVLNGESRKQITSPTAVEAKKVGLIEAWDNNDPPDSRKYCTGTNISEKHVITAAHCIIDTETGKKYDNVVYYPRHVNVKTRSPSIIFIRHAYILSRFMEEIKTPDPKKVGMSIQSIKDDIAILPAFSDYEQNNVGKLYGWYGSKPASQMNKVNGASVALTSYPGDKEIGTLWYESCFLHDAQRGIAGITCDTFKGASGSAIIWNSPNHNHGQIVGIYSSESVASKLNAVALFTPDIYAEILNVINNEHYRNKQFEKINLNTEKYYYFHVENKCRKEIKVAFRIQHVDGKWETIERYNVSQYERTLPIPKSKNSIYYYHARTNDGSIYWADAEGIRREAFGKSRPFYKKQVPQTDGPTKWGDYYRQVTCD